MPFLISYNIFYLRHICLILGLLLQLSSHFYLHGKYFFQPLTFSLYLSLGLKWVSCRQHIYGFCFYIHAASLFLLVGAFNPLGFPGGLEVKASTWNAGDPGSIPGLGRSPGEGKWQPTPVLLPGESHGARSLVGYSSWGCKESDTTERLHFHFS